VSPGARRVILDCDPGHDDAMAILLAAASPSIDLVAITTVAGNQTLAKTTLNARRVCGMAGITGVPVAAGCERPLVREPIVAETIHGASGLDGPEWEVEPVEVDPRDGVDVIVETGMRGGLTIVATGPLTNVATALEREPALVARLEQIVVMGGAIGIGNWTPAAEFNIYADPEAAQLVFDSPVPVTLVPLEVTHLALATPEVMARITELGTRVSRLTVDLMVFFEETYRRVFGFAHPPVHDPCAVAVLIDPTVVTTVPTSVQVELSSPLTLGRTVCDLYRTTGLGPNVELGTALDIERFWDVMIGALSRYHDR
jgi:inosine-uridine nucleoside N-ribohydrolase